MLQNFKAENCGKLACQTMANDFWGSHAELLSYFWMWMQAGIFEVQSTPIGLVFCGIGKTSWPHFLLISCLLFFWDNNEDLLKSIIITNFVSHNNEDLKVNIITSFEYGCTGMKIRDYSYHFLRSRAIDTPQAYYKLSLLFWLTTALCTHL